MISNSFWDKLNDEQKKEIDSLCGLIWKVELPRKVSIKLFAEDRKTNIHYSTEIPRTPDDTEKSKYEFGLRNALSDMLYNNGSFIMVTGTGPKSAEVVGVEGDKNKGWISIEPETLEAIAKDDDEVNTWLEDYKEIKYAKLIHE